jgi:ribonuclease HI
MMHAMDHDDFTTMVVTLWAIWHARRKLIHEDVAQSPLTTFQFIEGYIADLQICKGKQKSQLGERRNVPIPKWIAPPMGVCKVNTDGAVAKTASRGAVGVVCRSYEGTYLGASAVVFEGITHPGCLEAMACREALALLDDLHEGPVVIATDCLEVVKGLQEANMGIYSHVLQEVKEKARVRGGVVFRHENRRSNGEAHSLARMATSLQAGRHVWLGQRPEGLLFHVNILASD